MSVMVARTAGFCWGVRRAVDLVLAELKRGGGPCRVSGPLVHNPQVLDALAERGVECCRDTGEVRGGVLFLPTHGTTLEERGRLDALDVRLRDLTCPRVGRALALARRKSSDGCSVIILGDPDHREVHALKSYGGESAVVVTGPGDVEGLPDLQRPFLLSQTTQDTEVFRRTEEALRARFPGLQSENTICDSTGLRQEELRKLCPKADCAVVVGGRDSANTARLADIAKSCGLPVFLIESDAGLDPRALQGYRRILVTSGASTPGWVIRRVRGRLLEMQGATAGRALELLSDAFHGSFHVLPSAFLLGTAGALALGGAGWMLPVVAASLALSALHMLNALLESGFSHSVSVQRHSFLRRNRGLLTLAAVLSLCGAAAISLFLPPLWGLPLAGGVVLFSLYSMPLIRNPGKPPRGVRAIPGSRDLIFAAAWAFLLSLLPSISLGIPRCGLPGVAAWSATLFMLLLARAILLDLVDLQSDAMMGRDTIPLALGWVWSRILFWACVTLPVVIVTASVALDLLALPALGILAGYAWLTAGYIVLRRTPFPSDLLARTAADGSLLAAGILPLLLALNVP